MSTRSHVAYASLLGLLCHTLPACSSGAGAEGGEPEDVGVATAAITVVPANVACIDIQATIGGRMVDQKIDVTPSLPAHVSLQGLPLGSVTFTGLAYGSGCAAVTSTMLANWATDPVTATVSPGNATAIELAFHAAGGAFVGIDFDDAGATPLLQLSSSTLSFGDVECGHSFTQALGLTNLATWPVTVTAAAPSDIVVSPSTFTLQPGATAAVTATITPSSSMFAAPEGSVQSQSLSFTSSGAGGQTYPVTATVAMIGATIQASATTPTAGSVVTLANIGWENISFSIPGANPSTGILPGNAGTSSILFPTAGTYPITYSGNFCAGPTSITVTTAPVVILPPHTPITKL